MKCKWFQENMHMYPTGHRLFTDLKSILPLMKNYKPLVEGQRISHWIAFQEEYFRRT